MKARTLVLTGYGINCEQETAACFSQAGSDVQIVHLNQLVRQPSYLTQFHLLAIPGGFSFGDHLASGKILANKLKFFLMEELNQFIKAGKGIIGICNGFQALVKSGILPGWSQNSKQVVTLTHNEQGRFENRWVKLKLNAQNQSFWLKNALSSQELLELPVRHGEGRIIFDQEEKLERLLQENLIALSYQDDQGKVTLQYPMNPNGSVAGIAGLTNPQGNVFGIMPHPEAYRITEQAPHFQIRPKKNSSQEGLGMKFFHSGVGAMKKLFNLDP